jgi:hypothetical protein
MSSITVAQMNINSDNFISMHHPHFILFVRHLIRILFFLCFPQSRTQSNALFSFERNFGLRAGYPYPLNALIRTLVLWENSVSVLRTPTAHDHIRGNATI